MIDHILIRVSDVEKSKEFYREAFQPLGYKVAFGEEGTFHAFDVGSSCLFEIAQYTGEGSITSTHIAFRVKDRSLVDKFYEKALSVGAKCNGKPGPRSDYTPGYYACFVYGPDGHNIEIMHDEAYKK